MSTGSIRLVVKSRRRLVREAICAYLAGRPDFSVVGHTGTVDALPELCVLRRPDAVLVESQRLTTQKVDALARVRRAVPAAEVVVAYDEMSPRAMEAAVRAGITALVPCTRGLDAVLRAVRERAHSNRAGPPDGLALTDYDLRVASLLSLGHNVPEMANLLQISPRTVENRKRRLYGKLGVRSSGEAVSRATSLGLVDPPWSGIQPRREEPGRSPLVVMYGQAGRSMHRVQLALVAAGLPFVYTDAPVALGHEHWARWQRGPLVAVLVDPTDGDWLVQPSLGARIVVVLTVDPDLPTLIGLLRRGASALVRSDDVAGDLVSVLSTVVRGYVAVERARMVDLLGWMAVRLAGGGARIPELTERDSDILGAMAGGNTIRQTARLLGVTPKSVENAQARLYRKLGVRNREEALTIAHRFGLLDPASHVDASAIVP